MADNYAVRDANGTLLTIKSKATALLDANNNPVQLPQSVPSDPTGTPLSDANPAAVAVQSRQVTWIERSAGLNSQVASINTTSQQILAAITSRRGFMFQNLDTSNFVYLSFGSTAVAGPGSILVPPYSIYETPVHMLPTVAVYAITNSGTALFTCKEV